MKRSDFERLSVIRREHVPFWEKMDLPLIAFIDRLAVRLGEIPDFISTWRSPEKNAAVGGKPDSLHTTAPDRPEAKAADLIFKRTSLDKVYDAVREMDTAGDHIGGIGLYLTPQPDGHVAHSIHLDTGPRHSSGRPRLWGRPENGQYTSIGVILAKLGPGGTIAGALFLFFCLV